LSFAQERLWFLEQLEPGNTVYDICRALRLSGSLNITALEASLNEIVCRHEVLRSAIRIGDGRPLQVVQPPFELKLSIVDLQATLDAELEPEIRQRIQQAGEKPFDFAVGRFLRAELLRIADDKHILILATHHTVSDAWSMGILTRELWSVYEEYEPGKSYSREDLPVQYADFAVWQREWLQGDVLEEQLAYWKKQLSDLPILNLPTDRLRPPRQSFRGARISLSFSESLTRSINDLSTECGVTPFMTLLAAFQVLLYRYSQQEDIVLGSPIANRRRSELEPLIGFFVNTLVLRTDLSGNPTFKELLVRVRDVCLAGYEHQDLPFEKLVQEIQPERDQSRNPLFQVMFALQNVARRVSLVDGLLITPIETESSRSLFDLSLFLRDRDGRYIGHLEYSTDLYERATIERMAGHLRRVLEAIVADSNQRISILPVLTAVELHQLLLEWNDTAAEYPKDKCIHELFEEQVEKTPDSIAVSFDGQQLTYSELNARANQLAHYLQNRGVGPESLVAICLDRSLQMVVVLLGILKAGGAYVPLDPTYPKERLRFMVQDAQVAVLVTQENTIVNERSTIQAAESSWWSFDSRIQVVRLDRDWPRIATEEPYNLREQFDSESLAYVIYTSGSTGQPKGVMISHQSVVNHLCWARRAFSITSDDRVLHKTTLNFDASVWEIFSPLIAGAVLVVALPTLDQDGGYLLRLIIRENITLLKIVPSLLATLIEQGIEECTKLRHVLCGGETMPIRLQNDFCDRSSAQLHNLYGPTEATIDVTYWSPDASSNTKLHSVPIGRPIDNVGVYVLDDNLEPVPVGVPSQLYVAGESVARGYLHRPDLTAAVFIPNPLLDAQHKRLYKTGDIARFRSDGKIELMGRVDNQVKVRGHRIELEEIEGVLEKQEMVNKAVVKVQRGGPNPEGTLIAYVVPRDGASLTLSEVRDSLAQTLPLSIIPSKFVLLNTLPTMKNGKIDRYQLGDVEEQLVVSPDADVPMTATEAIIIRIWEETLQVESVGRRDNFFELGGHSLLGITIVLRVEKTLERPIPLRMLFEHPTIAAFAAAVDTHPCLPPAVELPQLVKTPHRRQAPLTMNQEQLWRLNQIVSNTHVFNVPHVYRLTGDLDITALSLAIDELIMRHKALRTAFRLVNGTLIQFIADQKRYLLPIVDLRELPIGERGEKIAELVLLERRSPFDLGSAPLMRARLALLLDDEAILMITLHHIICDQWSLRILRRELVVLYEAFRLGLPSCLPDITVEFADYAVWERSLLVTDCLKDDVIYWDTRLRDCAFSALRVVDDRSNQNVSFLHIRKAIEIESELQIGIRLLGRREGTTTFIVLFAAICVLLSFVDEPSEVRVGTLGANRGRPETEHTIGYFTNTLILCSHVVSCVTFRDVLQECQRASNEAFSRQTLPFEYLARVFETERGVDRAELCPTFLIYHKADGERVGLPGLTLAPFRIPHDEDAELTLTACNLVFKFTESSTSLSGVLTYRPELAPRFAAFDLVHHLKVILANMVSEPTRAFRSIDPL
jgi:amino acid adenylation domain-containing protein